MKPYYGAMNDKNQWFDGTDWKAIKSTSGLSVFETMQGHDASNCHVHGVFTCPRCRRLHFIPDQFDYLCDGCVADLNVHPGTSAEIKAGLEEWALLRTTCYSHSKIQARIAERDLLWAAHYCPALKPLNLE